MDNLGISLADYALAGESGAGMSSAADLNELRKALEAGQITGRETADSTSASGAPLKVESLENTLKVLTFKESDIKLWKRIPKLPAYNTVEEYNQLDNYGAERGGFNNEGELPEEEDSTYIRRAQLVKFLGTTRSVTHPMQLVNTHIGNVVQQETKNGTMWLLRKANKGLITGNADIIPQEFNSIYKQHIDAFSTLDAWQDSEVVVDLRGKRLNETALEDGALGLIENHGYGDLFMAPPKVLSNFVKEFHESKLIQPNTAALTAGSMGQVVKTFNSQFGPIELDFDKFMKSDTPRLISDPATHPTKAPNQIIPDGVTPLAAVTDTLTRFTDGAGDYYYAVAAINRYGQSALKELSTSKVTVAATEAVSLKFTDGGGAIAATGYIVYRSKKNPTGAYNASTTLYYPLFSVSKAQVTAGYDGGAAGIVRDRNRFIEDTDSAFLIQNDLEVWSFKQLAPLMKMDLAVVAPAIRFMLLLYGTPILYAPKKMVRFINIGTSLHS